MQNDPLQVDNLYDSAPAHMLLARHASASYPRECRFGVAQLVIDRDVFDPTLTNVSPFLLRSIDFVPGERVLDMFCGSGAFAINAALHGSDVVAIDTSPAAVDCAQSNAVVNAVVKRVDVRLGTMALCLRSEDVFDLVIANPPLLPGCPDNVLSGAIFDPELGATLDFIQRLAQHLSVAGRCYLLTSDVIDRLGHDVDRICHQYGLESSIVAKSDFGYENYRVHLVRHEEHRPRRASSEVAGRSVPITA